MRGGRIPRHALLAAGSLALSACGKDEETYFGNTEPPKTQRLVYLLESEPDTLDPALAFGRQEALILSLFEGLTSLHPLNGSPMSALATHFDVTPDGLRYTFYLRGHPWPRGKRLPNSSDLPIEYSRGLTAAAGTAPARWSDGVVINAHDFVYSWRRALDPSTAARDAILMYPLQNAKEISAGKMAPETLSVKAPDDYSVQVDLCIRAPFFLELVSCPVFCPTPRHAIQASASGWTQPGHAVTSGAFTLKERRPYDRIVLEKTRSTMMLVRSRSISWCSSS